VADGDGCRFPFVGNDEEGGVELGEDIGCGIGPDLSK
jgi:hypothetical protein